MSFGKFTAGCNKMMTSVENEPRRSKGRKFTNPNLGKGVPKGALDYATQRKSMLEPGKNSRSMSAHLFSLGHIAYFCLVDSQLIFRYSLSLSQQLLAT